MARGGSILSRLRSFDAYAKTLDDFRIKTTTGATVTIISTLIIALLVMSEFIAYRTTTLEPQLRVNVGRTEKMPVSLDITFPKVPCYLLSLDVMDDAGEHISDYSHDIYKARLNSSGNVIVSEKVAVLSDHGSTDMSADLTDPNYCGSCYGGSSETGCCNTCAEVRNAYAKNGWAVRNPDDFEQARRSNEDQCIRENYGEKMKDQRNEGCRVSGTLHVNKVRGNFHFAPGASFQQAHLHSHDMVNFMEETRDGAHFDFSHRINHLSFGESVKAGNVVMNPLDGTMKQTDQIGMMYQYFVKIVSTEIHPLGKSTIYTNQYSATQHEKVLAGMSSGVPGVFFYLDISPMLISYKETRQSFTSFLTSMCAIVGGIFTVAGLIDGFLYQAERQLKKKADLGKQF